MHKFKTEKLDTR